MLLIVKEVGADGHARTPGKSYALLNHPPGSNLPLLAKRFTYLRTSLV